MENFDVVIVGAGPAGLTAGIFCSRAGLKTLCLEKLAVGGQASLSYSIENFPSILSISGFDLANKILEQAKLNGMELREENVLSLTKKRGVFVIETKSNTYQSKKVILACGNKARKLGLDNEEQLIGRGISYCASCDGGFFKGKEVAVVGGGDTAVDDVEYLTRIASKIYLINRSERFKAGKRKIEEISKLKNVKILTNTKVTKLIGNDKLEAINVDVAGKNKKLKVEGLFIAIGHIPDLSFLKIDIKLDNAGYITVNEDMQSSEKNLFAAGDIVSKKFKQVITACSDGAIAGNSCIGEKWEKELVVFSHLF